MNKNTHIAIVDYISYINSENEPIGHPVKVMNECATWIRKEFEITFCAHKLYLSQIAENGNALKLPFYIREGRINGKTGILKQLFISWSNLSRVYKQEDFGYIWLTNIDVFILFYLIMHRKYAKRTIITTYLSRFPKKYQNHLLQNLISELKLLIYTNPQFEFIESNCKFIPDYLYNDDIYRKYKKYKEDIVVCVGEMNTQKDLVAMIEVFKKCRYKLKVIGYFEDKQLYNKLILIKSDNIEIEDEYLAYDNYLSIIATAKFCFLPYRKEIYKDKTSGVLLESIFLDTVPITIKELLNKIGICGIGYEKIEDVRVESLFEQYEKYIIENKKIVNEIYDQDKAVNQIVEMLKDNN